MQQLIEYASKTPEPQPEEIIESEPIVVPDVNLAVEA